MKTNNKNPSASTSLAPRPLRLGVETQTEDVRVELIPLIDVIFCILTFFILAAVGFSRQQAISIDIPKASTGTSQGREILMVMLNDAGQVFVEQQPMATEEQFRQRLREYNKQKPNGLMALYASTDTTYNQVVQVLDMLRTEGSGRVALATLPGEAGKPNASPSVPPGVPGVPGVTGVPGVPAAPGVPGVPGVPPAPGANSFDPYGLQNPATQLNPVPPPGQPIPGLPGANGTVQPLPGQPGVSPGNLPAPSPGTPVAPSVNNAAPKPNNPSNPTVPSPRTASPKI